MIFELINPSDAVTFVGDDVRLAGVAVLILGRGAYGLTNEAGETVVPIMLFGGHEDWLKDQGIDDLGAFIGKHADALAEFLDTCAYGHICDREAFDHAIALMTSKKAAKHRAWWNERNRSSMNNIGAGARRLAEKLRLRDRELPATRPIIVAR